MHVVGTDAYTAVESGNSAQQICDRTTSGGGNYSRSATGSSGLSSGAGTNAYTLLETGDSMSGHFTQSETGSDRYRLIVAFDDVSNTSAGANPGNVTFHTHGRPFQDPSFSIFGYDVDVGDSLSSIALGPLNLIDTRSFGIDVNLGAELDKVLV